MYEYKVLVPKERIGALIGDEGKTKRLLEKQTNTSILVSEEEVTVMSEDSLSAWIGEQIIKAIARGFNPKDAVKLKNEGYAFEVIDVMDYARNQNDKFRLRGRVIGEDGRTREIIEDLTGCKISIYGKTVGIIGPVAQISNAIKAVEMLLKGAQTATVYRLLEKEAKKRLKKELI